MTNVITRYFDSAEQAEAVRLELVFDRKFPSKIVRIYTEAKGLADTLVAADVAKDTAKAYQDRVGSGGAVLMVRAKYTPLGVARITRAVMAENGAADMGGMVEEVFVKDPLETVPSIFDDHRRFLTRTRDPRAKATYYMANWPIPLISKRKPADAFAFPRHARMANFPIPLISKRKPSDNFAFPRHARMANFPLPLISKRKPSDKFAFPRHARMANFPLPLISKRKPYTGSIIARHARMANWPFPHLINGKTGTNSLMPGAPRMANFPWPLISNRKPMTASIFPRHARMANFPISLVSKRKPYTGSVFPRHARMADFPIPLVIKDDDEMFKEFGNGSISKFLGLPTLVRR